MKIGTFLIGAFIFQLFFTEISLACKTTPFGASARQLKGALAFVEELIKPELSHNLSIKSVRNEDSGVIVETVDFKGNCHADLYDVSVHADCSTTVTKIESSECL